ncbi:MAG: terpene cyclase/mutase family protein [Planctomycetes bacterium]|nr:terpene cyclase/mutase family protein [Planctomycetota bacterium]
MSPSDLPFSDPSPEMNPGGGPREWVEEQVQRTPWWAISLAVHLLVVAVFMGWTMDSDAAMDQKPIGIILPKEKPQDEIKFPPPPDVTSPSPVEVEESSTVEPDFGSPLIGDSGTNGGSIEPVSGPPSPLPEPTCGPGGGSPTGQIGEGDGKTPGGPMIGLRKHRTEGIGRIDSRDRNAILAGLRWLARHQNEDGSWSTANFSANCRTSICEGKGSGANDAGLTGLALLAFLGAGYVHTSRDLYDDPHLDREICIGEVVKKAIRWLIRNQDSEGCFGGQAGGKYMYNHLIGTLAMVEAYGLTESILFQDSAQKGIDFTLAAQNSYKGWRYTKRSGDNDTSVTGWAVMALKSAELARLQVSRSGLDGAKAWILEVTDDTYFKTGYTAKGSGLVVTPENEGYAPHEALTAVAMMCRMFIDHDRSDIALGGGAKVLLDDLPVWDPGQKKIDFYYWYYGSLAMFQYSNGKGSEWALWNKSIREALLPHQRTTKDGCADGSWDSDTKNGIGRWAFEGGRVYTTAINTLTLETFIRYESAFKGASTGGGR